MSSDNKPIPFDEALIWANKYNSENDLSLKNGKNYFWYIVAGIILIIIIFIISILVYYYTSKQPPPVTVKYLSHLCNKSYAQNPLAIDEQVQNNPNFTPMQGPLVMPPSSPWIYPPYAAPPYAAVSAPHN